MRFRRWHRPEPYRDTPRKRAAFLRRQRLECEALPLFAEDIAAVQHSVDEEMARRAFWWDEVERHRRNQRAAWWRKGRARLFALPDSLRSRVREVWRTCPYPADPASFADFLHQIALGRLDPWRPPCIFHQDRTARITRNPSTFGEAFRRIGGRRAGIGPDGPRVDEQLFCGNLGSGILFLRGRCHKPDPAGKALPSAGHGLSLPGNACAGEWIDIQVRGSCSQADLALIERLVQAAATRRVTVQHIAVPGSRGAGPGALRRKCGVNTDHPRYIRP